MALFVCVAQHTFILIYDAKILNTILANWVCKKDTTSQVSGVIPQKKFACKAF